MKGDTLFTNKELIEISYQNVNFVIVLSTKFKEVLFNKNGEIRASFNNKIFECLANKNKKKEQSEINVI